MRPRACERLRLDDRSVAPEGSLKARLYLVGEAPGRHEMETGRPFVGPVGAALLDMMREAGIDRSDSPTQFLSVQSSGHRGAAFATGDRLTRNSEFTGNLCWLIS